MGAGKRFSAGLKAGADPGPIVIAALTAAADFTREAGLGRRTAARLAVVVEELVSNALRHGAQGKTIALSLQLERRPRAVAIAIEDDGVAFDPTLDRPFAGPDPVSGGGVGLALVRAWAETFDYARRGDCNRVDLGLRDLD